MDEPLDSVLLPQEGHAEDHAPFCRICLEEEGDMISPCQCTGTLAHVHEACLRQWREQFDTGDERAVRCQQCTAPYHVQYVLPRGYLARRRANGNMLLCGTTGLCVATVCFGWGTADRNLEAIFMAMTCSGSVVMFVLSWGLNARWKAWAGLGLFVGAVLLFLWVYTSVLYASTIMRVWQFTVMPFFLGIGTAHNVRKALDSPPPDSAFVVVEAR